MNRIALFASLLVLAVSSATARAQTNMLFILDGSNSMWGQIDGVAKIETARNVLGNLIGDTPEGRNIALMVYGHRSEGDCNDVELVSELGQDSPADLLGKIGRLSPKGKTPIAASLQRSEAVFSGRLEENNNVVLISDGIETCDGDPCAVAAGLTARGIDLRIHVVGFDVDDDARAQLECIAAAANGRYFDADSAEALETAVSEVKQVAETQPAPAEKPEPVVVFMDDFDGPELAGHWDVMNPSPDTYIVEDGALLVVSGAAGTLADGNVENMFRLNEALPDGDWTATVKFNVEYQTGVERLFMALYEDPENYLLAGITPWTRTYGYKWFNIDAVAIKSSAGEEKQFAEAVLRGKSGVPMSEVIQDLAQPLLLRIVKEGRNYTVGWMAEGADEPAWQDLSKFTILRQKGDLVIGFHQYQETKGESAALIDWVKIETAQ